MVVLGLLLLAAAVVVGIEVIIANTGPLTMHLWGWTWTWDVFWLAVGGAVIVLVGLLGLACVQAGALRSRRVRRERRALADENRRLAARADSAERERVERERVARARAEQQAATVNRPAVQGSERHGTAPTAEPGRVDGAAGAGMHAAPEEPAAGYPADRYQAEPAGEPAQQGRLARVLHRR